MRRYNKEFLLRVTLGYFTVNALYKLLQIICAKYYELRYMFYKKNCTSSKLAYLLDTVSKFALFSASGLKDEKLMKKANLHEN